MYLYLNIRGDNNYGGVGGGFLGDAEQDEGNRAPRAERGNHNKKGIPLLAGGRKSRSIPQAQ